MRIIDMVIMKCPHCGKYRAIGFRVGKGCSPHWLGSYIYVVHWEVYDSPTIKILYDEAHNYAGYQFGPIDPDFDGVPF